MFETERAETMRGYAERVAFAPLEIASKKQEAIGLLNDMPKWAYDDETPPTIAGSPTVFLFQLFGEITFPIVEGAPPQLEMRLDDEREPVAGEGLDQLFLQNHIYFFGAATGFRRLRPHSTGLSDRDLGGQASIWLDDFASRRRYGLSASSLGVLLKERRLRLQWRLQREREEWPPEWRNRQSGPDLGYDAAMFHGVLRLAFLSSLFLAATAVQGCGGSGNKLDAASGDASGNMDGAQPVQYFLVSWSIVDITDRTTTCGQAAASAVRVTVDATAFRFDCFSGSGMTGTVPPGSHTLNAELLSPQDAVISTDGPLTTTLDANVPKTLPEIVFYL